MSSKYVVSVRDLNEGTVREVTVAEPDPMLAHKSVFMKTNQDEEIQFMVDENGNVVFDNKKGFKKVY